MKQFIKIPPFLLLPAFVQARQQQQKQKGASEQGLPTFERLATLYEPTVSVITMKSGNRVLITVSDNGNGIPDAIKEKIFQPFFTTKPTGSGTGLGLSLSYDIVKTHGGEIKVASKEDEGSDFIIQLPLT
jgi:signal transduction histidine kinase